MTFFVHDPLTGAPYTRDPRNIARKAEDYLRGTGIGDTAFFGPEAEFYIFDSARSRLWANEVPLPRRLRSRSASIESMWWKPRYAEVENARRVEDVELRLGTKKRRVADAGAAEVVLRLPGDVARVPGVRARRSAGRARRTSCSGSCACETGRASRCSDRAAAACRIRGSPGTRGIDEPSNMRPVGEDVLAERDAGTVKCCIVPGRSQNLTSDELYIFLSDKS